MTNSSKSLKDSAGKRIATLMAKKYDQKEGWSIDELAVEINQIIRQHEADQLVDKIEELKTGEIPVNRELLCLKNT